MHRVLVAKLAELAILDPLGMHPLVFRQIVIAPLALAAR